MALKLPRAEALLTPEARRASSARPEPPLLLTTPILLLFTRPVRSTRSATWPRPTATVRRWRRGCARKPSPCLRGSAARLVADLADGVQHAHERGVLHRDIKPSNILMQHGRGPAGAAESNGEASTIEREFTPRITDFGLARLMDKAGEEITASFAAMGSAPYMAPEQAEGRKVGVAADVYGLGAILYVYSAGVHHTGESPISRHFIESCTTSRLARRHVRDVPRDLEAVCVKCLEKRPEQRYATARAVAEDLNRLLTCEPILARPAGLWEKLRRRARRHPAAVFVRTPGSFRGNAGGESLLVRASFERRPRIRPAAGG